MRSIIGVHKDLLGEREQMTNVVNREAVIEAIRHLDNGDVLQYYPKEAQKDDKK